MLEEWIYIDNVLIPLISANSDGIVLEAAAVDIVHQFLTRTHSDLTKTHC